MKHNDIKITLKKTDLMGTDTYRIVKLQGAINVDTRKRTNLTVGATVGNDEATELNRAYAVTVIQ